MERVTKMFKYLESWSENGDEAAYVHYMDGLYDLSDVLVSAINVNLHSYFDKNGSQKLVEEEAPSIASRWLGLFYKFHCMTGLQPGHARKLYDAQREYICDWQRCRHNWDPATGKKLRVCRGCGDSRYCGPDCQKL